MKNLFVPYPIAVIAKEKGFNEPCIAYYAHDYLNNRPNSLNLADRPIQPSKFKSKYTAAPLYQQLVSWLFNKHGVLIQLNFSGFQTIIEDKNGYQQVKYDGTDENKAIEEAFKLI